MSIPSKSKADLEREIEELRRRITQLEKSGSEDRFRSYFQHAPYSVFVVNRKGQYVDVNPAATAITGYSREELLRKSIPDLLAPQDIEAGCEHFQTLLDTGYSRGEMRFLHKSGATRHWIVTAVSISKDLFLGFVEDTTHRRTTEQKLAESHRILEQTEVITNSGSWEFDVATGVPTWSKQVFSIYGVDPSRGEPSWQEQRAFIHADDWIRMDAAIKKSVADNCGYDVEFRILLPDQCVRWAHSIARTESNRNGEVVKLIGTVQDITEKKQAEEEARNIGARYKSLYDSMNEGVAVHRVVYDSSGKAVDYLLESVNPAFESILGMSAGQVEGRKASEVYGKDEAPYLDIYAKVAETGQGTHFEVTFEPLQKTFRISVFSPGKGQFATVFEDITERQRIQEALRKNEDKLRGIVENSTNLFYSHTTDHVLTYLSPQVKDILGYEVEEALTRWTELATDHPANAQAFKITEEAIRTGQAQPSYELQLRHKDGHPVWVSVNESPYVENGKTVAIVGSLTDITDRKEAEEKLRQAQKMEAIGQLAGGLAHDYNNQLAAILNYADLLSTYSNDKAMKPFIDGIMELCKQSGTLTKQLLAFSRKGKYELTDIDIHSTISDVITMLSHTFDKRISIQQTLGAATSTVHGDTNLLKNLLLNLGLNSRDAMPQGGELMFKTDNIILDQDFCWQSEFDIAAGNYVRIRVSDSGVGMDEEQLTHLFEPFFTTKPDGKGTGMGLASVYGTVVSHHGAIEVESSIGMGTQITLYLPAIDTHCQIPPDKTAKPGTTVTARILVVDDDENILKTTEQLLRRRGHEVISANDGKSAIQYYKEHWNDIDLVILDMNMPMMNGKDTFLALRDIFPHIKAILSTGYSEDTLAQEMLKAGIKQYIEKPFRIHELESIIQQVLDT
jgi:two-component system cell cycle sensor histidine kinase/response regulator CckA